MGVSIRKKIDISREAEYKEFVRLHAIRNRTPMISSGDDKRLLVEVKSELPSENEQPTGEQKESEINSDSPSENEQPADGHQKPEVQGDLPAEYEQLTDRQKTLFYEKRKKLALENQRGYQEQNYKQKQYPPEYTTRTRELLNVVIRDLENQVALNGSATCYSARDIRKIIKYASDCGSETELSKILYHANLLYRSKIKEEVWKGTLTLALRRALEMPVWDNCSERKHFMRLVIIIAYGGNPSEKEIKVDGSVSCEEKCYFGETGKYDSAKNPHDDVGPDKLNRFLLRFYRLDDQAINELKKEYNDDVPVELLKSFLLIVLTSRYDELKYGRPELSKQFYLTQFSKMVNGLLSELSETMGEGIFHDKYFLNQTFQQVMLQDFVTPAVERIRLFGYAIERAWFPPGPLEALIEKHELKIALREHKDIYGRSLLHALFSVQFGLSLDDIGGVEDTSAKSCALIYNLTYNYLISLRDNRGNTILHWAAIGKNFNVLYDYLIKERPLEINADEKNDELSNLRNVGGDTFLHIAARASVETFSEISTLDKLVGVAHSQRNFLGNTPSHELLMAGNFCQLKKDDSPLNLKKEDLLSLAKYRAGISLALKLLEAIKNAKRDCSFLTVEDKSKHPELQKLDAAFSKEWLKDKVVGLEMRLDIIDKSHPKLKRNPELVFDKNAEILKGYVDEVSDIGTMNSISSQGHDIISFSKLRVDAQAENLADDFSKLINDELVLTSNTKLVDVKARDADGINLLAYILMREDDDAMLELAKNEEITLEYLFKPDENSTDKFNLVHQAIFWDKVDHLIKFLVARFVLSYHTITSHQYNASDDNKLNDENIEIAKQNFVVWFFKTIQASLEQSASFYTQDVLPVELAAKLGELDKFKNGISLLNELGQEFGLPDDKKLKCQVLADNVDGDNDICEQVQRSRDLFYNKCFMHLMTSQNEIYAETEVSENKLDKIFELEEKRDEGELTLLNETIENLEEYIKIKYSQAEHLTNIQSKQYQRKYNKFTGLAKAIDEMVTQHTHNKAIEAEVASILSIDKLKNFYVTVKFGLYKRLFFLIGTVSGLAENKKNSKSLLRRLFDHVISIIKGLPFGHIAGIFIDEAINFYETFKDKKELKKRSHALEVLLAGDLNIDLIASTAAREVTKLCEKMIINSSEKNMPDNVGNLITDHADELAEAMSGILLSGTLQRTGSIFVGAEIAMRLFPSISGVNATKDDVKKALNKKKGFAKLFARLKKVAILVDDTIHGDWSSLSKPDVYIEMSKEMFQNWFFKRYAGNVTKNAPHPGTNNIYNRRLQRIVRAPDILLIEGSTEKMSDLITQGIDADKRHDEQIDDINNVIGGLLDNYGQLIAHNKLLSVHFCLLLSQLKSRVKLSLKESSVPVASTQQAISHVEARGSQTSEKQLSLPALKRLLRSFDKLLSTSESMVAQHQEYRAKFSELSDSRGLKK